LDLRGKKWREAEEDYKMRSFITCTLRNIIRVTKPRRIVWVRHVARTGEMRYIQLWSENGKGRDHSEELGVDGRIILERILERVGRGVLDSSGSG
jgi:hypothetical protein